MVTKLNLNQRKNLKKKNRGLRFGFSSFALSVITALVDISTLHPAEGLHPLRIITYWWWRSPSFNIFATTTLVYLTQFPPLSTGSSAVYLLMVIDYDTPRALLLLAKLQYQQSTYCSDYCFLYEKYEHRMAVW